MRSARIRALWIALVALWCAQAGAQHVHWSPHAGVTHPISVSNCSCRFGNRVASHEHQYCARWERVPDGHGNLVTRCAETRQWRHVHYQVMDCRHVEVDRWQSLSFGAVIVDGSEVVDLTSSYGGGGAGGASVAGNAETYPVELGSSWARVGSLCGTLAGAGVQVRPDGCAASAPRLAISGAPAPDDLASWGRRCCAVMARARGAQSDNSRFQNFVTVAAQCVR